MRIALVQQGGSGRNVRACRQTGIEHCVEPASRLFSLHPSWGGKEWLAEQSPYGVYVELAMSRGIIFPKNCDLQGLLIELRDSLQVAEEDFLILVDAGGSPEIGAYARHLLAETAGPFPTDIPF